MAGVVYILANHAGVYCGKAKLSRERLPGLCGRLSEHVRYLLFPFKPPGDRPRYKLLRESLGAVFFLPCVWTKSSVGAYALESYAIRQVQPLANAADEKVVSSASLRKGQALLFGGKKRRVRRRPPSWRRRASPLAPTVATASTHTIWESIFPTSPKVRRQLEVQDILPGVLAESGPFSVLYVRHQRDAL